MTWASTPNTQPCVAVATATCTARANTASTPDGYQKAAASSQGLLPWLGIALIIILLDQFTKTLVLGFFQYGDSHKVWSFSTWFAPTTPGRRFPSWHMRGLAALVLRGVGLCRHGLHHLHAARAWGQKRFAWAMSLILGGHWQRLGPFDPRLRGRLPSISTGLFCRPFFPGGHFPAFNVADCGITIGAGLLILDELVPREKELTPLMFGVQYRSVFLMFALRNLT